MADLNNTLIHGDLRVANKIFTHSIDAKTILLNGINIENALVSLNGAQTISGAKTFSSNITLNNNVGIKWNAKSNISPYIGFCTTSNDGTFIISSIEGTTYTTGLAIGGTSKSLLWKGHEVLTDTIFTNANETIKNLCNNMNDWSSPNNTDKIFSSNGTSAGVYTFAELWNNYFKAKVESLSYVTTSTAQSITGLKTFSRNTSNYGVAELLLNKAGTYYWGLGGTGNEHEIKIGPSNSSGVWQNTVQNEKLVINGTAHATNGVQISDAGSESSAEMKYDSTNKCIKFVFS